MTTPPPLFLLINKPAGWTSFDAVNYVRKGIRKTHPTMKNIKVGHAGTLDPFATGLLIIVVGRTATRELDSFKALKKTYRATIRLGAVSDTDDSTGVISPTSTTEPTREQVETILRGFVGEQAQTPPMYSAKKVGGDRLYKLARQGITIPREPSIITIYSLTFIEYTYPCITFEVTCSAGTYIRTLARDIGDKLGTGAYCDTLTRTSIGDYRLADATDPTNLDYSTLDLTTGN
jgi:tRNA pseudouridine55 synthase